jgi:putative transposase
VPTLRPGDIVVLDNLGVHKGPAIRAAIRKAGARLLFLPAYSPDLNPIEKVFAKLKHLLRKLARRTKTDVLHAIAEILNGYTPEECAKYLVSAGYASAQVFNPADELCEVAHELSRLRCGKRSLEPGLV